MPQRASEKVCLCAANDQPPTAIKPLGPASLFLALLRGPATATTIHSDQLQLHHHHHAPTHSTQNSALTATTTQVPTCLWTLSSPWSTVYPKMLSNPRTMAIPWSTVCPKMPPPTVGDPSVEAASFLSNRTQVASSSRLGTYPIFSPSSPSANPIALQPGPLAC